MHLNPYLNFSGECKAAFLFYQQCLGGEMEAMLTFEQVPECTDITPEWREKIAHACLRVGDDILMGSDSPPEFQEAVQGFSVALAINERAEAERVFAALAEGGTIRMALAETSWAERFGMLVDRYGIPWLVNCEKAQ